MFHLARFSYCLFGLSLSCIFPLEGLIRHPAEPFLAKAAMAYGLPAIIETHIYPETDVIEWVLSNQMRVCLDSMPGDDQEVRIRAIAPGGSLSVPTIDRTAAEMSVDIAIASGIGELNGTELNAHLYDIHAELSTHVLAYAHRIEGGCPTRELPTFFALLHDLFAHPRFDKEVLPNVLKCELQSLRSKESDTEARFDQARFRMNSCNSLAFAPLSKESFKRFNYESAKQWYEKVFLVPQKVTLLVVGNCDADQLRPLILRYLATITPTKKPLKLTRCPPFCGPKTIKRVEVTGHTHLEREPLVQLSYFPSPARIPFPLKNWETVAQVIESTLRTAFTDAFGSTHGIDVTLEFPLYPTRHPFWITLGFRTPQALIDPMIEVACTTLEALSQNGTTQKEIERAFELQARNDLFWASDKTYRMDHLASAYHLGKGPAALVSPDMPSIEQINAFIRELKMDQFTIGVMEPTNW